MTVLETMGHSAIIRKLKEQIVETGMKLETGTDFQVFKEIVSQLPNKTQLGPRFDPENNDFDREAAFWIVGRNHAGQVVHTQALGLTNLHGRTLSQFLERHFTDFIPFETDPRVTRYFPGPGQRMIRGTTCYHGELWLRGGESGFRGMGMAAPLVRLALLEAMRAWSPDYIYGFMHTDTICKGLAARAGFLHMEPDSITWARLGETKVTKHWTTWLGREDLVHLMNLTAMDMELPMVERTLRFGLKQVA